jgi:predicted glycoside hydrolase/deacetylase ChbG (UPF0249 family)
MADTYDSGALNRRLGHGADARLLIVNCDDLGSSHAANVAIHRAMTAGVATSASLMVPCPWAREAAAMCAGQDVGVHLTLTAEYPGYRWRSLTGAASLHDADGFMPATMQAAVERAHPEDVRSECRAQIEQALAWGVDVTHLDSHMGVVQFDERLFTIYVDLAVEFALPLRMVGAGADARLGFEGRRRAAGRGVLFTDYLIDSWPRDVAQVFFDRIASLRPGVAEIFGHPVDDGPELRGYDPDQPELRARDALCFTDPAAARLIDEAGVIPISYRPLRNLQRGAPRGFEN